MEGKALAHGSAGKCGEMDLTDNIQTACAFLKMSAVQQEALMGLREDGCAPLLGKSMGQGLMLHLRFWHSLPAAWEV